MSEILDTTRRLQGHLKEQKESIEKIFGILDRKDIMRNVPKKRLPRKLFMEG